MNGLKRHSSELDTHLPLFKSGTCKVLREHIEPEKPRKREAELRIVSARYNFDRGDAIDQYQKAALEQRAVEDNLTREKSLLRNAYIINRQRKRLQIEPFNHNS